MIFANIFFSGIISQLEDVKRNGFLFHNHKETVDDTEAGLLQTAFIVSYMLLSPLFGYLGDRYTRKYIVTIGILIWSAFTLAGSFSVVSLCVYVRVCTWSHEVTWSHITGIGLPAM